jgi:phosphoribosyl 1,2-cyclic phosphate phosphodiesterase
VKPIEIEVLGSAGAVPTPRALCQCAVCIEALEKGPPFSRCGPSYFIHGPNILIDTPEEIRIQLTRSRISAIEGCFYSHWHPDHVAGRRIFETNLDFTGGFVHNRLTPVYLPRGVSEDFRRMPGIWDSLTYMEKRGIIKIVELKEEQSVQFKQCQVTPIHLAAPNMYAFLIETTHGTRGIIAPDEVYRWTPPENLCGVDVAILQNGLFDKDPFTGVQRLPQGLLEEIGEINFEMTLSLLRQLGAKRAILSHLEEPEGLSHSRYQELERKLAPLGLNVSFAYDMQRISI